jgi:hypothetical protein
MREDRRTWRCRSAVSVALLTSVLVTGSALAQTDEQRAGARAAAQAGGKAYGDGKYADAVDLFTRAESLVHSPVHLLYTARSYEKLGQLVHARETYIKIVNEEQSKTAPEPYKDAKRDAEKELAALEPRLPSVSVVVRGVADVNTVSATMDGQAIPAALIGVPRPVDPADHRFEATAPGYAAQPVQLKVLEGRNETVTLDLQPTGEPIPVATPTPAPVPTAAPTPTPAPVDQSAVDTGSKGPSPFTWVAFGVGAVGLGVGTVFALKAKSNADDANSACQHSGPDGQSNWCTAGDRSKVNGLDDDSRSAKSVAIAGFVVGGVGLVTGITLLIATSKHEEKPVATRMITPWVGLGSAGVSGRF